MYGYIYVTTNLINGRKYICQHAKPEFDESYYGSGTALKPAIKKYGKENFICKAVDWAKTKEELDQKEIDWIDKCGAVNSDGYYNISYGGYGAGSGRLNHRYGKHWSEEEKEYRRVCSSNPSEAARRKMSEASRKFMDNGGRELISERNKKYWRESEEGKQRREKQRESWSGSKNPMYGVRLTGELNPNYGKHISDEQKKTIFKVQSVAIVQLSAKDLELIAEFPSIKQASESCCISNYGIGACCRKEQKTSGGFMWMYKTEYESMLQLEGESK